MNRRTLLATIIKAGAGAAVTAAFPHAQLQAPTASRFVTGRLFIAAKARLVPHATRKLKAVWEVCTGEDFFA